MSFETREGTLQYYLNLPLDTYFNADNSLKMQSNDTVSQVPGLVLNNTIYNTTATNASKYINKDYFERITGKNYYKNFNVQTTDIRPINAETQRDIELNYFNTLKNKRHEWINIIRLSTDPVEINNANNQIYQIDYAINRYKWQYLNIKPNILANKCQTVSMTNDYLTPNQIQFIASKYHVNKQEILKNLPTYRLLLDYDLDTTEILNFTNFSKQLPIYISEQNIYSNPIDFLADLWEFYNVNRELKSYIKEDIEVNDPIVQAVLISLNLNTDYYINMMHVFEQLSKVNNFEEYYEDISSVIGRCLHILMNKPNLSPITVYNEFTYYNLSLYILPNIRRYRQEMLTPYMDRFVFSDKLYAKYPNVNKQYIEKFKPIFQALYTLNVPSDRINLYL